MTVGCALFDEEFHSLTVYSEGNVGKNINIL
jgi:hypothetical protein